MFIFTSYESLLIKRFLFSKKSDGFVSIFSWISIIGIMIGVAAIIIVMGVMNGFREELTDRLLGINGHLNIYSSNNEINKYEYNFLIDKNTKYIISPSTQTQALIISDNESKGVVLRGYDNQNLNPNHFLKKKIIKGSIFQDNLQDVVIGYALANQLNSNIGSLRDALYHFRIYVFLMYLMHFLTYNITINIFLISFYKS